MQLNGSIFFRNLDLVFFLIEPTGKKNKYDGKFEFKIKHFITKHCIAEIRAGNVFTSRDTSFTHFI